MVTSGSSDASYGAACSSRLVWDHFPQTCFIFNVLTDRRRFVLKISQCLDLLFTRTCCTGHSAVTALKHEVSKPVLHSGPGVSGGHSSSFFLQMQIFKLLLKTFMFYVSRFEVLSCLPHVPLLPLVLSIISVTCVSLSSLPLVVLSCVPCPSVSLVFGCVSSGSGSLERSVLHF